MNEPDIIEDLDTPGELERGYLKPPVQITTTTLDAARQTLRDWIVEAEDRFKLTPLEVLGVVGTVLGEMLTGEGHAERDALSGMQDAMAGDILEGDPEPEEPVIPTCCRKHNMMGRDDGGDCKGGPVAGGKPKLQRPVPDVGDWDGERGAL